MLIPALPFLSIIAIDKGSDLSVDPSFRSGSVYNKGSSLLSAHHPRICFPTHGSSWPISTLRLPHLSFQYTSRGEKTQWREGKDHEHAKFLSSRLRKHDEAFAPREHEYVSIEKKVTDETGRIIAGLVGGVDGWNGTDIDALRVDEPYHRQGIGTRLLREFEREAKENGADVVFIEAYDWNVGFFRKNGYGTVTGVLEDYPRGHTMYCMQRSL